MAGGRAGGESDGEKLVRMFSILSLKKSKNLFQGRLHAFGDSERILMKNCAEGFPECLVTTCHH